MVELSGNPQRTVECWVKQLKQIGKTEFRGAQEQAGTGYAGSNFDIPFRVVRVFRS